jgi:hypothetical protein
MIHPASRVLMQAVRDPHSVDHRQVSPLYAEFGERVGAFMNRPA